MTNDQLRSKWASDPISNACVIRVTNQCDQKCRHCIFRSGPECVGQMSVEMCKEINAWVPKRVVLNIMGGEFTILKDYSEMLVALARNRDRVRLVTNGFWANNPDKFFGTIQQIKDASCSNIDVAVSQDGWHEKQSHRAMLLLKDNDLKINLVKTGNLSIDNILPIGRAWDNNLRGFVVSSEFRGNCKSTCSMIITEDGMLCKCPFGYMPWKHFSETTWADAQKYIWEWRSEKLADNMNCNSCMEEVKPTQRRELVSLTS